MKKSRMRCLMKYSFFRSLIIMLFFILQPMAFAQNPKDLQFKDKVFFFLGTSFGHASIEEGVEGLSDKDGYHFDLRGLAHYKSSNWGLDLGGGWFFNKVEKDAIYIETHTGFFESSLYYNFNQQWAAGVILNSFLNVDSSFSTFKSEESNENFLGIKVNYIPPSYVDDQKIRFHVRTMKSMSIENRDVYITSIGIDFGFPLSPSKVKYIEKVVTKETIKYKTTLEYVGDNGLRATLGDNTGLNFESGSHQPSAKMVKYIERLAYFLLKFNQEWEKVSISGHTDDVGSMDTNLALSQKRALAVKNLLIQEGIDPIRVTSQGFGPTRPKVEGTTTEARLQNRRVEIEFHGLKNPEGFRGNLSVIE